MGHMKEPLEARRVALGVLSSFVAASCANEEKVPHPELAALLMKPFLLTGRLGIATCQPPRRASCQPEPRPSLLQASAQVHPPPGRPLLGALFKRLCGVFVFFLS